MRSSEEAAHALAQRYWVPAAVQHAHALVTEQAPAMDVRGKTERGWGCLYPALPGSRAWLLPRPRLLGCNTLCPTGMRADPAALQHAVPHRHAR